MKRKLVSILVVSMMTLVLFTGCKEKTDDTTPVKISGDDEATESNITPPVLADFESYEAIIKDLKPGQAYAFVDMDKDHDALLVTDGVFDNLDGNMAAIDARIYGYDKDGNIIEYGTVESDGTAYPLAVYDGYLMFGGNHHMGMEYIDESYSSIITKEDASEVFDENANATYHYFSYDDEFEGEVEDDSKLVALYEKYDQAIVINFTVVE